MSRKTIKTGLITFLTVVIGVQSFFVYTAHAQYFPANIPKPETLDAIVINNSNQVLLRGQVTNTAAEIIPMKGYFEWGTTKQLGNRTFTQDLPTARVVNFSHVLTSLSNNRQYYYRVVAFNEYGAQAGAIKGFRTGNEENLPPPVVVNPNAPQTQTQTVITYPPKYSISNTGAQVTFVGYTGITDGREKGAVTWFEWGRTTALGNRTSVNVLNNWSSGTFESGRVSGFIPNTQYYVRAVVKDKTGTNFGDVISFSLSDPEGRYMPQAIPQTTGGVAVNVPYVVTYLPDIIRTTSGNQIQFKGYAEVHENRDVRKSANIWFEWGETPALGERTSSQFFGGKGTLISQERFTGFEPNRLYYYRAAVQDPYGTAYGDIVSFSVPEGETQAINQGGGFLNLFGGAQSSIVDIRDTQTGPTVSSNGEDETKTPGQDQIAIVSANGATENGIFPSSFIGWLFLVVMIFLVVGLILYVGELNKKLKKLESQNGNNEEVLNKNSA